MRFFLFNMMIFPVKISYFITVKLNCAMVNLTLLLIVLELYSRRKSFITIDACHVIEWNRVIREQELSFFPGQFIADSYP